MDEKRCEKSDDGKMGCVKASGHGGRCKVRSGPAAIFAAGGEAPGPSRAGAKNPKNLAGSFEQLGDLAGRIEAEANGLMADCRAAVASVEQIAACVGDKNRALLKSLVASRRQMQKLSARGDASAAASSQS